MNNNKCPFCGSHDVVPNGAGATTYRCHACMGTFVVKACAVLDAEKNKKSSSLINHGQSANHKDLFFANIMKKVVEIRAYFDGNVKAGSGFFISPEYVMTNAHIIFRDMTSDSMTSLAAHISGNDYSKIHKHTFELVSADISADIAILKSSGEEKHYADFAANIYNGEKVFVVGNSQGQGLCILDGIVSDISRIVDGNEFFMTSALVTHGNSGCPVFNENGQVLGMITEGSELSAAMNYAIPAKRLISYANKVETDEEIKIF